MPIYARIIFVLVYTIGYLYFAVENLGAGHGTSIFLAPFATWLLVAISIVLLSKSFSARRRATIVALLGVHYIVTGFFVVNYLGGDNEVLRESLRLNPIFIALTICWYFVGQAFVWKYLLIGKQTEDLTN